MKHSINNSTEKSEKNASEKRKVNRNDIIHDIGEADFVQALCELEQCYREILNKLGNCKNIHPELVLRCCRHRGSFQYYVYNRETKVLRYAKQKSQIVRTLAQRDYNIELKDEIEGRLELINRLKLEFFKYNPKALYRDTSKWSKTDIQPLLVTDEEYASLWQSEEYEKYGRYDSDYHVTCNGEKVRSKSEVLIANELVKYGIPYKYEKPVKLNGVYMHPDFTILLKDSGREIIWEHLGLMDNDIYRDNAFKKIQDYESSGYKIGTDLIISIETSRLPLTVKKIDELINMYCK